MSRLRSGRKMKPFQENTCKTYDWTLFLTDDEEHEISIDQLVANLNASCAKWTFQLEETPTTGSLHWQGRLSLKTKGRRAQAVAAIGYDWAEVSITSNANRDNMFYVLKEETYMGIRMRDTENEEQMFIPWDVELMVQLRNWQQVVVDSAEVRELRKVNIIVDERGGKGKTSLGRYISVHRIGEYIPPMNDFQQLMEVVMDLPKAKLYMIDIPKATDKGNLAGLFSAIEWLKSGCAYDRRYKFRREFFNPPQVWVFTNKLPNPEWLSADKWKVWKIAFDMLTDYETDVPFHGYNGGEAIGEGIAIVEEVATAPTTDEDLPVVRKTLGVRRRLFTPEEEEEASEGMVQLKRSKGFHAEILNVESPIVIEDSGSDEEYDWLTASQIRAIEAEAEKEAYNSQTDLC